jgi:hypothetical protein
MLARATVWYHDGLASRGGLSCHLDITLYQQWQFEHQSRITKEWKHELLSCRTTLTITPSWGQLLCAYKTNLCGMKITSSIRVFGCTLCANFNYMSTNPLHQDLLKGHDTSCTNISPCSETYMKRLHPPLPLAANKG